MNVYAVTECGADQYADDTCCPCGACGLIPSFPVVAATSSRARALGWKAELNGFYVEYVDVRARLMKGGVPGPERLLAYDDAMEYGWHPDRDHEASEVPSREQVKGGQ